MDTREDSDNNNGQVVNEHKDEKDGKEENKNKKSRKRGNNVLDISVNSGSGSGSGSDSGTVSVWADRLRSNKRPRHLLPEVVKRVSSSRLFIDFTTMASTLLVEIASFLEIRNRINFAKAQKGNYLLLKEPVGRIIPSVLGWGVGSRVDNSLGNAQQQLIIPISDFMWIDRLKYGPELTPFVFRHFSDMSLRQYTKRRLQTYYNEILASTTSDIRGKVSRSRLRKIGSHVINHLTQLNQAACFHCDVSEVCLDSTILFQELSTCPELEPYRIESKRMDVLIKQNMDEFVTKMNQNKNKYDEWINAEKARIKAEKKYHDTPINEKKKRTTPFLGLKVRRYPDQEAYNMAKLIIEKREEELVRDRVGAIFKVMPDFSSIANGDWDIDTTGPLRLPLSELEEKQFDEEKSRQLKLQEAKTKERDDKNRKTREKLELQKAMHNNLLNLDPSQQQNSGEESELEEKSEKEEEKEKKVKSERGALCWPLAFAFRSWVLLGGNLKVLTLSLASESEAKSSIERFKEYVYDVWSADLDHGLNARRKKLLTELHNKYDAIFDLLRMSSMRGLKTFNLQTNRIWFPNHVKALRAFIKNSVALTSLGLDYQDVFMPCDPIHYDPNSEHPTTYGAKENRMRLATFNEVSIVNFHDAIITRNTPHWKRLCVPRPVRYGDQVEENYSRYGETIDFVFALFQAHGHFLEEFSYKWMSLPLPLSAFTYGPLRHDFVNGLKDVNSSWPKLTSLHISHVDHWGECKSALQFLAPSLQHLHLDEAIALFDIVAIVLSPKLPLVSLTIDGLRWAISPSDRTNEKKFIDISTQLPHLQKLCIKFRPQYINIQTEDEESKLYISHQSNLNWSQIVCNSLPKLTHFMMCSTSGPLKSFEDASYVMTNNKYLRHLGQKIGSTLQTLVLPYGYRLEEGFEEFYTSTVDNAPLFPNLQVLDFGTYANQKMYHDNFHQVQSPDVVLRFVERCLRPKDGRRIEIRMITVPSPDPTEDKIILYDYDYDDDEIPSKYDFEILCIAMLSAKLRYQVDENYDDDSESIKETIIPRYSNVNVAVVDSKSASNMFFDPADLLDYEQFRARIGSQLDKKELKGVKIRTRDELMQELAKYGFNDAEHSTLESDQFEHIRRIASELHLAKLKRQQFLAGQR